ncbi:MAG: type II secretion system protein, partial [Clostridia bacterium]|nr:type II secretion system protein [Clostridia bacterium]
MRCGSGWRQAGYILVESLVGAAILSLAALGGWTLLAASNRSLRAHDVRQEAASVGLSAYEAARAQGDGVRGGTFERYGGSPFDVRVAVEEVRGLEGRGGDAPVRRVEIRVEDPAGAPGSEPLF